ncbi:MAG TPA: outer membrane beta-barrel protein [Chthoniobacterales bacterium]|jgi:hypothetical protein
MNKYSSIFGTIFSLVLSPLFAGEPVTDKSETTEVKKASSSRIEITGWLEGGITGNFASPNDRQNFGRLFDDRSNEPLLNQFVLMAERTLDPATADRFDWGFRTQFLYGSDARYLHSTGLLDLTTNDTLQPDIPEAWVMAHFPITGTAGGIDLKVGKFGTCIGAEMSDPRMNPFYSHSYIFNYGAPFNATGVLATLHASSGLDLYAGVTRGVNVTFDDPNDSVSFYGGVGGSLAEGRFSYMAMTHIGAENPGDNHDYRYLNAITLTWKATDKLTSMTDLNYIYDAAFDARGYGIAQYFTYAINDWLTAGIRGEVWRDADGFYVAQFASNNDFIHFLRGDPTTFDPRTVGGGRTTYGALTLGLTFKPPVPKPLSGLLIRPEIRYDRSLNDTRPFNDSSDIDMLTAGLDVIFSF